MKKLILILLISFISVNAQSFIDPFDWFLAGDSRLLDKYDGAVAAYSLRLLSSSYNGDAIKVRRSSDDAEQDIGFVGGVLDEASLLSFVGAGDGFVTTWYDQSGNSNNATQGTAANQPKIVSSGAIITLNSKATISYDGTSDYLRASNIATVLSGSDKSIYIHSVLESSGNSETYFGFGRQGFGFPFVTIRNSNDISIAKRDDAAATKTATNSTPLTDTRRVLEFLINGTTATVKNNGSTIIDAQDIDVGATTLDRCFIGARAIGGTPSDYYASKMQEIIIFPMSNNIAEAINEYYGVY